MADYFSKPSNDGDKTVEDDEAAKGTMPDEQYHKVWNVHWLYEADISTVKQYQTIIKWESQRYIIFLFLA